MDLVHTFITLLYMLPRKKIKGIAFYTYENYVNINKYANNMLLLGQ